VLFESEPKYLIVHKPMHALFAEIPGEQDPFEQLANRVS
jgi:hypothetical protein